MTAPDSPGPATVDWTKPILWDGKPARVLATDLRDDKHSVVIAVQGPEREWLLQCRLDGSITNDDVRVTNAPERVERWANVYGPNHPVPVTSTFESRAAANAGCNSRHRTALVKYTFEADRLVAVEIVPLEERR